MTNGQEHQPKNDKFSEYISPQERATLLREPAAVTGVLAESLREQDQLVRNRVLEKALWLASSASSVMPPVVDFINCTQGEQGEVFVPTKTSDTGYLSIFVGFVNLANVESVSAEARAGLVEAINQQAAKLGPLPNKTGIEAGLKVITDRLNPPTTPTP